MNTHDLYNQHNQLSRDGFRTKKAARAKGYRTSKEWQSRTNGWKIPLRGSRPTVVKGEEFFTASQCEEMISKSEASRRGLAVKNGISPAREAYHQQYGYYDLYRISDCRQKRKVNSVPPVKIDLLLAVFTVNRAAKRYRDAASKHYSNSRHGFASTSSLTKTQLYELKDRGMVEAVREGRLQFCGKHKGYAIYRGDDYCFHSFLVPKTACADDDCDPTSQLFYKESAPKESTEARLKDAEYTLDDLPNDTEGFLRIELPQLERSRDDDHWDDGDPDDEEGN